MSKKRRHGSRGSPKLVRKTDSERRRELSNSQSAPVTQRQPSLRHAAPETASAVPFDHSYDLDLPDRARRHWRAGEWASLQAISASEIEHHPARARLALLVATGHHACGNAAATRSFSQIAMQWGCDRELVARALIGGVHNTLGRAAVAAGHERERALRHFDLAVAPGVQGSPRHLSLQARIDNELAQMGLTSELPVLRAVAGAEGQEQELPSSFRRLSEDIRRETDALAAALKVQRNEMAITRKYLDDVIKREVHDATRQLESFVNLQGYLSAGTLVPDVHEWAVSPDFAQMLLRLVHARDYDLIIEFGSGSSTLLMATALARNAKRRQGRPQVTQVAFEHLQKYHAATLSLLAGVGLAEAVELVHAPLAPYIARDGRTFQFYDCRPFLSALGQGTAVQGQAVRILVLVDGPPAATGAHARYPALPLVRACFGPAKVDVVMDDYVREDEKEIVKLWINELQADNVAHGIEELRLEKGACILSL